MKTPYLDKMINDLQNHIESVEVASHAGIPETRAELAEYEAIKEQLALHNVVGRSEQLKCGNNNPPCSPDLKFGVLHCCECEWGE